MNWYNWYYDGDEFCTRYNISNVQRLSFKDSLIYNAEATIKEYGNEPFELMYSGGLDSELVLRVYKELGHKINVNIFRYEKDYNIYDVSFAVITCEKLGIQYKIIDFNLEEFYKTRAFEVFDIAKCSHARALPQMAFLHEIDGIPVYAAGEPICARPHSDYSMKADWELREYEFECAWSRYAEAINRPAIMQWFKFTPEVYLGWTNTEWFNSLTNDEFYGKMGVNSTKISGYREAYPDLVERIKKTGFELAEEVTSKFQSKLDSTGNGSYNRYSKKTLKEFYDSFSTPAIA